MTDQLRPYEPEYMKGWRERLEAKPSKPAKPVVKKRKGKKVKR